MKPCIETVNFMTSGVGVLIQGLGQNSQKVLMHIMFKKANFLLLLKLNRK